MEREESKKSGQIGEEGEGERKEGGNKGGEGERQEAEKCPNTVKGSDPLVTTKQKEVDSVFESLLKKKSPRASSSAVDDGKCV